MTVKRSAKDFSSGVDDGKGATFEEMRDGDRLKQILEQHGKKPVDLERALGKSRQMIHNYLKATRFSPNMRETVKRGLEDIKIDPEELTESPTAITDATELRSLLDGIPHDALPKVKRMLEITDKSTKIGLIAIIDDRLERKRS